MPFHNFCNALSDLFGWPKGLQKALRRFGSSYRYSFPETDACVIFAICSKVGMESRDPESDTLLERQLDLQ